MGHSPSPRRFGHGRSDVCVEIRGSRLEKEKVIAAALVLWMAPIALQSGLLVTVQTDFAERLLYTASIPAVIWLAISLGNIPGSIKTTLLCFIFTLVSQLSVPHSPSMDE